MAYDYGSHEPAPTHHRDVRVRIPATAIRPPRRGAPWTVEAGHSGCWRAEGTTEKAAVAALAGHLQQFLEQYREPLVITYGGYVAVLTMYIGDAYHPVHWTEQVITPDGRISHSGGGAESWQHAEAQARFQLAARATDYHDDRSVHEAAAYLAKGPKLSDSSYGLADSYGPADLYRDAAWQRAAKTAIAAGRDDWHEWASDHRAEFTIPQPGTDDGNHPAVTG